MELAPILVQNAKIQQSANVRGKNRGGVLIKLQGLNIVTTAIVFQGQSEEGSGVGRIGLHGSLVQSDDLGWITT